METVWKFSLEVTDEQHIEIPNGAEILTVQTNGKDGQPYLYAKVDTERTLERKKIITRGTGHKLSILTGKYIGTYQYNEGLFVFHVFEEE